jgi:hypothetical protein
MITTEEFKQICETQIDWNRVFGAFNDVSSDPGLKSNADNFFRSKAFELAICCFSPFKYVDEDGVDFHMDYNGETIRIEQKALKGFFYGNGKCKQVKMKNYRGDVSETAFNRFKTEDKFDFVMIIDYLNYKVAIASRETAQECYVSKGDGVMSTFTPNVLTVLNIDPNTFTFPSSDVKLSETMNQTIVEWITNR